MSIVGRQRLQPGRQPVEGVGHVAPTARADRCGRSACRTARPRPAAGRPGRPRPAAARSGRPRRAAGRPDRPAPARAQRRRPRRVSRSSTPPGAVNLSTSPPGRISRSIGPSGASARPSGGVVVDQLRRSGSPARSCSRGRTGAPRALGDAGVPASPSVRWARPSAPLGDVETGVCGRASPTRAGVVASSTRLLPRFMRVSVWHRPLGVTSVAAE